MTSATPVSTPQIKRSRAPRGVDSSNRVLVSLFPAERAELERRALDEGRSIASLARIYLVRGMAAPDEAQATEAGAQPHAAPVEHD